MLLKGCNAPDVVPSCLVTPVEQRTINTCLAERCSDYKNILTASLGLAWLLHVGEWAVTIEAMQNS